MSAIEIQIDSVEIKALGVVAILLFFLYIWIRNKQRKNRLECERKLRCKEMILNKRHVLAAAGVDFQGLVSLVKAKITPEQLEKVIGLLTSRRVEYNIDNLDDPDYLEVDFDLEEDQPEEEEVLSETSQGEEDLQAKDSEKMTPEGEKAWLKLAHNRFRRAIAEKEISERRAKLKLLIKMVELGKKAVEEDPTKDIARREYEISLWDRFYENEYLELQSE